MSTDPNVECKIGFLQMKKFIVERGDSIDIRQIPH